MNVTKYLESFQSLNQSLSVGPSTTSRSCPFDSALAVNCEMTHTHTKFISKIKRTCRCLGAGNLQHPRKMEIFPLRVVRRPGALFWRMGTASGLCHGFTSMPARVRTFPFLGQKRGERPGESTFSSPHAHTRHPTNGLAPTWSLLNCQQTTRLSALAGVF